MLLILAPLLLTLTDIAALVSYKKLWRLNTDLSTASNWRPSKVSCQKNVLQFSSELNIPVQVADKSLKFGEIVLPNDGTIEFQNGASLSAADPEDISSTCVTETLQYEGDEARRWQSGESWCLSTDGSQCAQMWTPELIRIPCMWESAWFPAGQFYHIDMKGAVIVVQRVYVGNQSQTQQDLFSRSAHQFKWTGGTRNHFTMTGKECEDPRGCVCETLKNERIKEICQEYSCPNPDDLPCLYANKFVAGCCDACVAQIYLNITADYKPEKLNGALKGYSGVAYRISDNQVEVAVNESESKLVVLADYINNNKKKLGVSHIKVYPYDIDKIPDAAANTATTTHTPRGEHTDEYTIIGVLFILLLALLLVLIRNGTIRVNVTENRVVRYITTRCGGVACPCVTSVTHERMTDEVRRPPEPTSHINPLYDMKEKNNSVQVEGILKNPTIRFKSAASKSVAFENPAYGITPQVNSDATATSQTLPETKQTEKKGKAAEDSTRAKPSKDMAYSNPLYDEETSLAVELPTIEELKEPGYTESKSTFENPNYDGTFHVPAEASARSTATTMADMVTASEQVPAETKKPKKKRKGKKEIISIENPLAGEDKPEGDEDQPAAEDDAIGTSIVAEQKGGSGVAEE